MDFIKAQDAVAVAKGMRVLLDLIDDPGYAGLASRLADIAQGLPMTQVTEAERLRVELEADGWYVATWNIIGFVKAVNEYNTW